MNKTIKTNNICEIIYNIDNPKEAKKIEDTINKVIKENKNKSIETEEGLIHISKVLKVMGRILSYYIDRIELSCGKDYVLGIEKGMIMSLRDDINKLSARYKI